MNHLRIEWYPQWYFRVDRILRFISLTKQIHSAFVTILFFHVIIHLFNIIIRYIWHSFHNHILKEPKHITHQTTISANTLKLNTTNATNDTSQQPYPHTDLLPEPSTNQDSLNITKIPCSLSLPFLSTRSSQSTDLPKEILFDLEVQFVGVVAEGVGQYVEGGLQVVSYLFFDIARSLKSVEVVGREQRLNQRVACLLINPLQLGRTHSPALLHKFPFFI